MRFYVKNHRMGKYWTTAIGSCSRVEGATLFPEYGDPEILLNAIESSSSFTVIFPDSNHHKSELKL